MGYIVTWVTRARTFVLTALELAVKKFLSRAGRIFNFQAYKRSKPHFTEVFACPKRSSGTCCYAWKSEFRAVFTEVATLVHLAKNGAEKLADFWKLAGICGNSKNGSRRDRKMLT